MIERFHKIKYCFSSDLNEMYEERYITEYNGEIIESDIDDYDQTLVGKIKIKLMCIGQAIEDYYSLASIFDVDEFTWGIYNKIMDPNYYSTNETVLEYYDQEINHTDICIIERMELIASARGSGLGKKIVKDIYNRFSNSCGLFIVQAFPLQFEESYKKDIDQKWISLMDIDTLEADYEKAFYQLKSFYQKLGFDHIDGLDEYMFMNPIKINQKLLAINF